MLNGHPGHVVWLTGLPGAGKPSLANALEVALHAQGVRIYVLDGDNVRQGLSRDLGFSDEDRVENIRSLAEVARRIRKARAGLLPNLTGVGSSYEAPEHPDLVIDTTSTSLPVSVSKLMGELRKII